MNELIMLICLYRGRWGEWVVGKGWWECVCEVWDGDGFSDGFWMPCNVSATSFVRGLADQCRAVPILPPN